MATVPKGQSGVQELIGRLRDEGVKAGEQEADRLLQEAGEKAEIIKSSAQAKKEADQMRTEARAEIEAEQAAAREAIRLAFRETELKIQSELKTAFAEHVRRLVTMEFKDREFLRQLILVVCGRVAPEAQRDQPVEVLLANELFISDGKETRLTEQGKQRLGHFILGISSEMLREGVQLKPSGNSESGMTLKLVGEDLEIDLSAKALTDMLLKYLIPRYRAIVEGVE